MIYNENERIYELYLQYKEQGLSDDDAYTEAAADIYNQDEEEYQEQLNQLRDKDQPLSGLFLFQNTFHSVIYCLCAVDKFVNVAFP